MQSLSNRLRLTARQHVTRSLGGLALTAVRQLLYRASILLLCHNVFASDEAPLSSKVAHIKAAPLILDYQLIETAEHPHHTFTQGLIVQGNQLWESSGGYGRSFLQRYPITEITHDNIANSSTNNSTNNADDAKRSILKPQALNGVQRYSLPNQIFAEGITVLGDTLYLLTWKAQTALLLDRQTWQVKETQRYQGEGWGLTHNGAHLIRSDGSHQLFFHRPDDFSVARILPVTIEGQPLRQLNELEYAQGAVWANIWKDSRVVQIHPQTGRVMGVINLSTLVSKHPSNNSNDVLNGIAYDANKKAFWVTGKHWDKRYLIKIKTPVANP